MTPHRKTDVIDANPHHSPTDPNKVIVLFDGYCVLCSSFAQWIRKRSIEAPTLLAMQSNEGQRILRERGLIAQSYNEVVIFTGQEALTGSEAIIYILSKTQRPWRWIGCLVSLLPGRLVLWGYQYIAHHRYRWFGKRKACKRF